jgi:transcriptional regulator with XRE-family HTH domain
VSDGEWTKRLQAARAYADKSTVEIAELLGISDSTYKRIEGDPHHYKGQKREGFLTNVSRLTKVPVSFFEHGWAGEPALNERVEALEHQYATLAARLAVEAEARGALADSLSVLQPVIAQHTRAIEALAADRRRGGPGEGSGR